MAKKIKDENGNTYKLKKPFYKRVWFWILVVIVIIAAGSCSDDKADKASSTKAQSSSKQATKVKKGFALDSNDSVKSMLKDYASGLVFTDVNGVYYEDGSSTVALTIKEDGSDLSDKMAVRNMYSDVLTTWNALKKAGAATKFENMNVAVSYPMQNGQQLAVKTTLSGSKLSEFDKQNMSSKNVPTFATTFWKSASFPDL
ncbi:hypothetical protein [Lapidilactobacillus luobeiensis]|uniref:hypothetical protein n=1 Tax=Lapidilactobacillus luobeiensis TaxID=2950371 RepID=UPI0021C38996|nr:hypothetical protein [Lapidilactobacillus luobeiensis]